MIMKARSYAASLLSRVFGMIGYSGKVNEDAKHVRKLSCNGLPGVLPPCIHRVPSQKVPASFYCSACGCGDKRAVLVSGDTPAYEKLDYPHLVCPIAMPGFSNYMPSDQDDIIDERKIYIEQEHGVQKLILMRDEQKRIFKFQIAAQKTLDSFRSLYKIGRGISARIRSHGP